MHGIAEYTQDAKYKATMWILVGLTAFLMVLGIAKSNIPPKSILYALVIMNVLLVGYLLLIRDIGMGVVLYLYSLTFLNYYWRLILPGMWPDIDIPRMMFIFIWMVVLLETLVSGRRLLPRTNIEWGMLAVLLAVLGVMLTLGRVHIRQYLNGYAIPYAMFIVAKNSFETRKSVDRFLLWFIVPLSIYFPLTAIFEHYRMTQLIFPKYILSPEVGGEEIVWGGRAMGVFLQPVATGFAFVGIYVLSIHALSKMKGAIAKLIMVFITLVTPVAVFFTYTRSVYMGYGIGLLIIALFSRRSRVLGAIVLVALVLGVLGNWENVTSEDREVGGMGTKSTAQSRLVLVEVSLKMFADRPFVGVGFTRFKDYAGPYVADVEATILGYREAWVAKRVGQHNHFLTVLTEIGLIGFVPLVLVYFFLLRTLWKAHGAGTESYDGDFVVAVWAVWAGYIINILFIEPRFFEFMNVFPFILAGIVVGGYQRAMLKRFAEPALHERSLSHEGTVR